MANIILAKSVGINDSLYGKSEAAIYAFLEKRAEAFEQESVWDKLFTRKKSNRWAEKIGSMTAMAGPKPVGENGLSPVDGFQEGYSKTIEHMAWRDQFAITREMIDDATITDLRKRPLAFMTACQRKLEQYAAAMYGNAINGNGTMTFEGFKFDLTTADGVSLFNASHPSKTQSGYTQSNIFSNTVSADNLGLLETHQQNVTDDDGNILAVAPDTIVIPNIQSIKKAVFEAVGSDKNPVNANNAMNYQFGRWNIIVWPYLNRFVQDGDTPWILLDSKYLDTYDAAVWFDRVKMEVNSYVDNSTLANVWQMYFRFGAGFVDWRAFHVGGIASASALS